MSLEYDPVAVEPEPVEAHPAPAVSEEDEQPAKKIRTEDGSAAPADNQNWGGDWSNWGSGTGNQDWSNWGAAGATGAAQDSGPRRSQAGDEIAQTILRLPPPVIEKVDALYLVNGMGHMDLEACVLDSLKDFTAVR